MSERHERTHPRFLVLDEKHSAIAHFKRGPADGLEPLLTDSSTDELERERFSRVAAERPLDLESDPRRDSTLRSGATPTRLRRDDAAAKDELGALNELVERGRNDGGRAR
jgi:hypothetical protein